MENNLEGIRKRLEANESDDFFSPKSKADDNVTGKKMEEGDGAKEVGNLEGDQIEAVTENLEVEENEEQIEEEEDGAVEDKLENGEPEALTGENGQHETEIKQEIERPNLTAEITTNNPEIDSNFRDAELNKLLEAMFEDASKFEYMGKLYEMTSSESEVIYDNWKMCETFVPIKQIDYENEPGLTEHFQLPEEPKEVDSLLQILDEEFINNIIQCTNEYMNKKVQQEESNENQEDDESLKWKNITINEMYIFLALTLLMPHCKKQNVYDYWRDDDFILTPSFEKIMKRERFMQILENLNFNKKEEDDKDRLDKIRYIFENLKSKFKKMFIPFKNAIVNGQPYFKGNVFYKQVVPSKRLKFEYKMFMVCDIVSGSIVDFIVYTGKNNKSINTKTSVEVEGLEKLINLHLESEESIPKDTSYFSKEFRQFLIQNHVDLILPLKNGKRNQPQVTNKSKRGRKIKNLLEWNIHESVDIRLPVVMPIFIDEDSIVDKGYTKDVRLIDKFDMLSGTVDCLQRKTRWDRKFFFNMIDLSVYNAHRYYQYKTKIRCSLRIFIFNCIKQLLKKNIKIIPNGKTIVHKSNFQIGKKQNQQYIKKHFIDHLPPTAKKLIGQRMCLVCSNAKSRPVKKVPVRTGCNTCDVALCVGQCFVDYHTKEEY